MINVRNYGVAGDNITDDTAAINSLLAGLTRPDTIYFPSGNYRVTNAITIAKGGTQIVGDGSYATVFVFTPKEAKTLFLFRGPGELFGCSLKGVGLYSGEAILAKTGVELVDTSGFTLEDVRVSGNTIGEAAIWSGANSVGLKVRGREALTVNRCNLFADIPIRIQPNPNNSISIDHSHFCDLYLVANNNPCVLIDSGVNLSDVTFDGRQAWVHGTYGFYWVDTETKSVSYGLSISNVRWEQAKSGWAFYHSNNHGLQNLLLENWSINGDTEDINGIYLHNAFGQLVSMNLKLSRITYARRKVGLDLYQVDGVSLDNVWLQQGATVNAKKVTSSCGGYRIGNLRQQFGALNA